MNQRTAKGLRRQSLIAKRKHPDVNTRHVYQMAKKDYLATPRKQRSEFSIFENV